MIISKRYTIFSCKNANYRRHLPDKNYANDVSTQDGWYELSVSFSTVRQRNPELTEIIKISWPPDLIEIGNSATYRQKMTGLVHSKSN